MLFSASRPGDLLRSGDQPHAIAGALDAKAVAVEFDFVDPIRRVWNLGSPCRNAPHAPKIDIRGPIANPVSHRTAPRGSGAAQPPGRGCSHGLVVGGVPGAKNLIPGW